MSIVRISAARALVAGLVGAVACSSQTPTNTDTNTSASISDSEDPFGEGPPVDCPYPDPANPPVAALNEGFSPDVPQVLGLSFFQAGALASIENTGCEPEDHPNYDAKTETECYQAYRCDQCLMVVGNRVLDSERSWYLVPDQLHTPECAHFDGFYLFCDPVCDGKECGDDGCGGSCGSCDAAEDCYSGTCLSEPSCPMGCQQGGVCCGGLFCAGDCVGTPCCL
ncbi:MAG: hypothetical protein ACPG4T_09585 [Nannocystaceae bacterium]